MIDLAARQVQILRAIIEEFINTATPVGSDTIDKKYNIGVSPATIRNEMVKLTELGYLTKVHKSSGRVPTPTAFKLYINELMKEKELSVADEVSAKEKIWKSRDDIDDLIQEAVKVLADRSQALGVALVDNTRIYHSGYSNLLNMPEFFDINLTRHVFNLIEEEALMQEIFDYGSNENPVKVVFGQELGNKHLEPVGIVYSQVNASGHRCQIGVLGSNRFNYPYVFPTMKLLKSLIEELI